MTLLRDYLNELPDVEEIRGDILQEISGVTIDSRCVKPGFIFCAVRGANIDANAFIPTAIAAGAVAIVSESECQSFEGVAWIRVKNSYHAASHLAMVQAHCPADKLNLWGITGTNGKTTSAFLLREIFNACVPHEKVGMIGTIQYSYGNVVIEADRTTPPAFAVQKLFAEMEQVGVSNVVLEMSSHALEQRRLGRTAFRGAIFSNLSGDHLDYHGTMENYYQCKKMLFTRDLCHGGIAIINCAHETGVRLASEIRNERPDVICVTYGFEGDNDYCISVEECGITGSYFIISGKDETYELKSPMIGTYNIENIAGVFLLGLKHGFEAEMMRKVIAQCLGAPGRLEPILFPQEFAVYVDYAHTDDALLNVLTALRPITSGKVITVFGCGGDRDRSKRPRMGAVASANSDIVIVTSDNPRTEDPQIIINDIMEGIPNLENCRIESNRHEAIRLAVSLAQKGDVILLAGKGHENYQDQGGVKHHFDDREEVLAIRNEMTNI